MATAWRSTVVVRIKNAAQAKETVMQMKTVKMAWCADSTTVEILKIIQLTKYPPVQMLTAAFHRVNSTEPLAWYSLRRPARTPQPQDGRDQEEDAVAQVRDGRALQDHRRLRGGHQGGCRQG